MSGHTPGPWAIRRGHSTVEITTTTGLSVAQTTSDRYWQGFREEALANARVLAAAPELLACLRDLLALHEAHHNHPTHAAARAALRKAESLS